ncbi:peptide ABC transporter substrate-binding protein [Bifidobacterium leontopitheci]|uniref:ABC transporter substrate-binding protein n=1 Tax=Bifidobacterium leontopitheci TaxID=2650774 RepID=A0A6I1GI75_9BIFI|nr:ABC transporter substrate-binding protein [Bifidobacterium leontopitheci]KAB7791374.1 ABC transporter substrate-binding protein [Bifidobacterium leontopitheci]
MKKKALAIAAAACAAAMLLSGCGSSSNNNASAESNIITVNGCEPAKPLVPSNTVETCGGDPISEMFSNLVRFDDKGNAQNEVAESITANDDMTQYTIKLKDWKFSDGTTVKAENFTKAWSWAANAKNAQLGSSFFNVIKGYDDLQKSGLKGDEQLSGLKVVDDKTFTVDLNEPSSTFPILVGYAAFAPLADSFFKDPKAFGNKPVTNGPYTFQSWDHNQFIKLLKNKDYKGTATVNNDGLTFKVYTDTEAAYKDVQAGNLDAMDTVAQSAIKTFKTDSSVQAVESAGSVLQYFIFPADMQYFAQGDKAGLLRRQAISMAVNRQQIIDKIGNGTNTPAVDFTAPVIPGYSDSLKGNEYLKYNKEKAKAAWDEANKISPIPSDYVFKISYNADGGGKDTYDAIANSIKNTLGINAEATPIPTFSEFNNTIEKRQIKNAFRQAWQPDYPSPDSYLKSLYSSGAADGNGSNNGDYKNAKFDSLLSQAASAKTTDEANKYFQQAEEQLLADMPSVPLWYANAKGVAAKGVKNFKMNWQNVPIYEELSKK